MERNELLQLANFFFEKRITVHIKTEGDSFYNGLIIEIVGEDYILINDRMLGETPVAFSQIKRLERFRE
jgi:hypothetical protein